jgi:ComF family protein
MISFIVQIYIFFLDVFFPKKCIICRNYGKLCCTECIESIEKIYTSTCPGCGKISGNSKYCQSCRTHIKPSVSSIIVACSYQSPVVKEIIHSFKYLGMTEFSEYCADLVSQRLSKIKMPKNLVIVPVPLHRYRCRQRGFNQAELIARSLSEKLKVSGGDALARIKKTKNQVGLFRDQRLINLTGAFSCVDQELILGKNILLVDDVVTTGSTLNECAKVLKQAGAKSVIGVVVARNI